MGAHNPEAKPEIRSFTADDGVSLQYREWIPARSRGVVVCLHGIRSHAAWYLDSCNRLYRRGYRVVFPDRRGSGINRGKGESNPRYRQWIADTVSLIKKAEAETSNAPIHLLGISWGGRLAVAVAARGGVKLTSIILSAPGLVSKRDYPFGTKIGVLLALLSGSKRLFTLPLVDSALFTDDSDERNYIEEDALGLSEVTARFLVENRKLERFAKRLCGKISIPTLLLLAERDEIVDNDGVKKLFARIRCADKIVKVYPGARHTLEFDGRREDYFRDLIDWLSKH